MRWTQLGILICLLIVQSAQANDEVTVTYTTISGTLVQTLRFNQDTEFTLTVPSNVSRVNVFPTNGQPASIPTLGHIILSGPARSSNLFVHLGAGNWPGSTPNQLPAICGDWRGMGVTSGSGVLARDQVKLTGAINGTLLSPIQVGEIARFDIGVQVNALVETSFAGAYPLRVISLSGMFTSSSSVVALQGHVGEVRGSTVSCPVSSPNGNVIRVTATGGNIMGNVSAGGSILEVAALSGTIGSPLSLVSITAGPDGNIHRIEAQSVHASIVATGTGTGTGGTLGTLRANTGVLRGTVNIKRIASLTSPDADGLIFVAGNLNSDININENVFASNPSGRTIQVNGQFPANRIIRIGGSLSLAGAPNPGGIQISASNLLGQVIINAQDSGGTWAAPATVGATSLSPIPQYTQLPGLLGGGSVGLMPYYLHAAATADRNSSVSLTSQMSGTCPGGENGITLEFYGPVQFGGQTPLTATLLDPLWGGGLDVDLTQFVDVTIDALNPRLVHIKAKPSLQYLPSGNYEVTPTADLDCSGTLPGISPPDVRPFTYLFTLLPDCAPADCVSDEELCADTGLCDSIDFNNDGLFPDTVDIDNFLLVFSGAPCPTTNCNDIDFNNDGLFPDTNDIEVFLDVFGGGPCLCISGNC